MANIMLDLVDRATGIDDCGRRYLARGFYQGAVDHSAADARVGIGSGQDQPMSSAGRTRLTIMENMDTEGPSATLDARFSSPGAEAQPWDTAVRTVSEAELYWLATVRTDGRPHVTPLLAVWMDERLHFCTGPGEQKAKNLAANDHCALLTGSNVSDGLDVVVEGRAVRVTDEGTLRRLAAEYEAKYGAGWRYTVEDGAFRHAEESLRGDDPGTAIVFSVVPETAFGFGKGAVYSQTRWRFGR